MICSILLVYLPITLACDVALGYLHLLLLEQPTTSCTPNPAPQIPEPPQPQKLSHDPGRVEGKKPKEPLKFLTDVSEPL